MSGLYLDGKNMRRKCQMNTLLPIFAKKLHLRCLTELWIRLWWHTPNFISAENIIGLESQHKKWSLQLWISSVNVTKPVSLQIWSHLLRKSVMENLFVNIIKHKNNFLPQNTHAHKNRQENHKVKSCTYETLPRIFISMPLQETTQYSFK